MMTDAPLQVWLDAEADAGRLRVVPYVKSATDMQLQFRLDVIQASRAGNSRIRQQGQVQADKDMPTALAQLHLGTPIPGSCHIELALDNAGKTIGTYRFDCPR